MIVRFRESASMIRWIDRLDDIGAGVALFTCFAVVSMEIFARAFLGTSFMWSEELSRYLIIVSAYLGAAAAVRTREHIRVELILQMLPGPVRRWIEVLISLACAGFAATVAVVGYDWVRETVNLGLVSAESSLPVSIWVFQLAVPVGFAVMALRLGFQAWQQATTDIPERTAEQAEAAIEHR